MTFSTYSKESKQFQNSAGFKRSTKIKLNYGFYPTSNETQHHLTSSMRSVIQHLLIFTITRGILISLAQVGHIIMYTISPDNVLFWSGLICHSIRFALIITIQQVFHPFSSGKTIHYHNRYVCSSIILFPASSPSVVFKPVVM